MPKYFQYVFIFVFILHSFVKIKIGNAVSYNDEPNGYTQNPGNRDLETTRRPGMKVRLSQYGVNNGTNALIHHFSSKVKNISSSGCRNFTSYGGFIAAIFCWRNFEIRTFEPFNLTAKPAANNYLHVFTSGGRLNVVTEFKYELLVFPIPWVLSAAEGSLKFSSSNLSLSFDAKLDKSSQGNPEPKVENCRASVNVSFQNFVVGT